MTPLSQRSTCHEQKHRHQTGRVQISPKQNPLRSIGRFLSSLLRPAARSMMKQRPNYSRSLSHLSEHQLRDIGFTRDPPELKLPEVNVGVLQSGLHEYRRNQIRRLPKN